MNAWDEGTVYVKATLTDDGSDGSVGLSFALTQPAAKAGLLRYNSGSSSYDIDNVIWPVATDEVRNMAKTQLKPCDTSNPASCLKIWITSCEAPDYETGCRIWVVWETDNTAARATLEKYQVDTTKLRTHISLAKSDKGLDTQICQKAVALNEAINK